MNKRKQASGKLGKVECTYCKKEAATMLDEATPVCSKHSDYKMYKELTAEQLNKLTFDTDCIRYCYPKKGSRIIFDASLLTEDSGEVKIIIHTPTKELPVGFIQVDSGDRRGVTFALVKLKKNGKV